MATFFYVEESQNCLAHAAGVGMENPEGCRWVLLLVPLASGKECALALILPFLLSGYYTCCKMTWMQSLSSHTPASDTSSHQVCLLGIGKRSRLKP